MAVRQADAMFAFFVNVQLVGNFVFLQCEREKNAVVWNDPRILVGVPKECWWSILRYLLLIRKRLRQVFGWIFAQKILFRTEVRGRSDHRNHGVAENS